MVAKSTGESTIELTYSAVGAETYSIYKGVELLAEGITSTTYTVTDLDANTEYCFAVKAVNEVGTSEFSEEVCAKTYKEGTEIVSIGDGTIIGYYAPICNYGNSSNYSLSQQIYLKDEINSDPCAVASVSFHNYYGGANTRNIVVYMTNVDKDSFASDGSDWVEVSESDIVYQGEHTFGANDEWTEIELQTPFIYEGSNVCITINDLTDEAKGYSNYDAFSSTTISGGIRGLYKYRQTPQFDLSNMEGVGSGYALNSYNYSTGQYTPYIANVKFRTEPAEANVFAPESIALGDVRMGEYWTEKHFVPKNVQVSVVSTTVTSVTCDNNLFVLNNVPEGNAISESFTLKVDYDKTVVVDKVEQTGTITIAWGEDKTTEITVTANAYTAVEGDVIENPFEVEFDENGSYSYTITTLEGMYDDYIFSDNEQYDANCPDAVFAFTLDQEALITVPNYDNVNSVGSWMSLYGNLTENGPQLKIDYPGDKTRLAAGTYYVVVSPNLVPFNISITKEAVPTPEISYSNQSDGATNQDDPLLQWNMQYADEYQVLFGTDPENLEVVVDWTDELDTEYQTSDLDIATKYYWQVNAKNKVGKTEGAVRSFVSVLPAPKNVKPENEEYTLLVGDSLTLNWDEVDGAIGYNVYKQGDYNSSTYMYDYELLGKVDTNGYELYAEYDNEGSKYAVSAVFEGGFESEKTVTSSYIYVLGMGSVTGKVTDQEGNPIAGALLELSGTTGFGDDIHILETETDGTFIIEDVIEGTYTLTISHYNYEEYITEEFEVEYGTPYNLGTITLTAKTAAEGITVTATEGDNIVNVAWTGEYEKYNVYRRNVETGEFAKIASDVTLYEYEDTDWADLANGTYQYGVSALVEQNLDYSEEFEDGIPSAWSVYNARGTASTYDWTTTETHAGKASYNGTYAAYAKSSNYGDTSLDYYYMVTDLIDLSNLTSVELSFAYHTPDYYYNSNPQSNYTNTLKVKILTEEDGQNSATPSVSHLWTSNKTHTGDWVVKTLDLSSYAGKKIYVAFENYPYYGACSSVDAVKVSSHMLTESAVVWSESIEKVVVEFTGAEDDNWHNAANWSTGEVPTAESNVIISAAAVISSQDAVAKNITIASGASVTVNAERTITAENIYNTINSHSQLIINDGAQVIQNNENTLATFKMGIVTPETWGVSADGWQFIAAPFTDAAFVDFTGFMATNYDLFKYDGEAEDEWQNHKDNVGFGDAGFVNGRAYLASHEVKETASIYGTLNSAKTHTYTVTYNVEKDLANFHLLGNPFSFNMNWSNMAVEGVYDGFAIVNSADGSYDYFADGNTIPVGDGFFVYATAENPTISYGAQAKRDVEKHESINLIVSGANGDDNAIINLAGSDKEGFLKLDNINEEIANIYFSNGGRRYAISNFDRETTEIPVSFDAKQMGNYTISIEPNGKFDMVTLVDRFTGVETNMLIEDYNFTATGSDNHDRFIVKLVNSQEPTANSNFVYQLGEELILSEEGTVQIIDVMGRVVYSNDVIGDNNRINVSAFDNAAYVIRVINENGVKVQKVVIY